jgi:hypothetical protein
LCIASAMEDSSMNIRTHFGHFRAALLVSTAAIAFSSAAFAEHGGGGHAAGVSHVAHVATFHGGATHSYYRGGYSGARYYGSHYYGPRFYGSYRYGPRWYGGLALGAYVASLPFYYSTYWWGGIPYYYYDNTYYRWDSGVNEYEVVAPPNDAQAPTETSSASSPTLYAYPSNGQSAEQQKTDRYECHRWAVDQTGFDPTTGTAGQPMAKRDDYLRAETSCLNGRGYSVR